MRKMPQALVLALAFFLALGPGLGAQTSLPPGATWELGFSPSGGAQDLVLKTIASAQKSLLLVAYELTDRDVAEALEAAAHRGVKVRIVADFKAAQGKYSQVRILRLAGIPLRLDAKHPITHDKFMVIDGSVVETGSYNYSQAAAKRNAENVLVLAGVPDLASTYAEEFERLWAESQDY